MFGKPKDVKQTPSKMPHGVQRTPHGTFKTTIKRVYLGTFKEIDQAINAVTEHIKKTQ